MTTNDRTRAGAQALIDRALDLYERSGSHSTGALARDRDGKKIRPSHAFARKWDVNGALCNAAGVDRLTARPSLELAHDGPRPAGGSGTGAGGYSRQVINGERGEWVPARVRERPQRCEAGPRGEHAERPSGRLRAIT